MFQSKDSDGLKNPAVDSPVEHAASLTADSSLPPGQETVCDDLQKQLSDKASPQMNGVRDRKSFSAVTQRDDDKRSRVDSHRVDVHDDSKASNGDVVTSCDDGIRRPLEAKFSSYLQKMRDNTALFVDVMSRILFPVLFTVFNLIYWLYYSR